MLHDVGKIVIPKEILNKPTSLTDSEFEVMKTHTIEGQFMLDRVGGLLGRVGEIVRSCHERWDGKGYPDGLAGKDIPFHARIVFCCDAYNAITSDRVYRRAKTSQDALDELEKNAGTQFDPEIVDAVCRVIAAGRPVFSVWTRSAQSSPALPWHRATSRATLPSEGLRNLRARTAGRAERGRIRADDAVGLQLRSPERVPLRSAKAGGRRNEQDTRSRGHQDRHRPDRGHRRSRNQEGDRERPRSERVLGTENPAGQGVGHRGLDEPLVHEQHPVAEARQGERREDKAVRGRDARDQKPAAHHRQAKHVTPFQPSGGHRRCCP